MITVEEYTGTELLEWEENGETESIAGTFMVAPVGEPSSHVILLRYNDGTTECHYHLSPMDEALLGGEAELNMDEYSLEEIVEEIDWLLCTLRADWFDQE